MQGCSGYHSVTLSPWNELLPLFICPRPPPLDWATWGPSLHLIQPSSLWEWPRIPVAARVQAPLMNQETHSTEERAAAWVSLLRTGCHRRGSACDHGSLHLESTYCLPGSVVRTTWLFPHLIIITTHKVQAIMIPILQVGKQRPRDVTNLPAVTWQRSGWAEMGT